ncbi:ANKRD6 family protein [Megaselia abdita]
MHNGSFRGPQEEALPNTVIHEDTKWTELHECCAIGDDKRLENLLGTTSVDRTAKEAKHGNTALHEAAWRGHSRCVKILCAPPHQRNCVKDVNKKLIKGVILETRSALHSALLGIRNDSGFSALHLAAQNGHNQSCREILLAGGDPDVQNNYGDTPLHTSCRYGHAGAARIILSANCDSNKTNLNGDTALHIACAMGRRKLTRILIEGGETTLDIKNGQQETPMDIAVRKDYSEIVEILKNPTKMRNRTGRSSKRHSKKESDQTENPKSSVNWSPYGCHYFPDPRTFPSPKLDTLPKEPLKKGEQYYLDLAGNIRKGPKGVGNTCYCGPFFKHIEEKINKNRKSIRKYVHKATERLDNKVQALAIKTDDQIEQLARTIVSERVRCEDNKACVESWLKRGGSQYQIKTKKLFENSSTLTRCKSLDMLDDDSVLSNRLPASRSIDILDGSEVVVHRNPEESEEDESFEDPTDSHVKWDGLLQNGEYYSVSERLEELLLKTNEILEIEKGQDGPSNQEMEQKSQKSSILTMSENSNSASIPQSLSGLHISNTTNGGLNLDHVISALRKDRQRLRDIISAEYIQEIEVDDFYHPPQQQTATQKGFFHNDTFDQIFDNGEIKEKPVDCPPEGALFSAIKSRSDWKSKMFSSTSKKVEAKNNEMQSTSNLPKRNKVQELVARLQGKFSSSNRSENNPQSIPNNISERIEQNNTVDQLVLPNNEELLFNRPMAPMAYTVRTRNPLPFVPSEFEEVPYFPSIHTAKVSNIIHQHHLQHPELHHTLPMTVTVEREVSNDSGFSMRGGSHHPSPSLSGNCEYVSVNGLPHCNNTNVNNSNNSKINDYLHGSLV